MRYMMVVFEILGSMIGMYLIYRFFGLFTKHLPAFIVISVLSGLSIIVRGVMGDYAYVIIDLIATLLFMILVGTIPKLQSHWHDDETDEEEDEEDHITTETPSTQDKPQQHKNTNQNNITTRNLSNKQGNHKDHFSRCPECGFDLLKNDTECMWCGHKCDPPPALNNTMMGISNENATLEQVMEESRIIGTQNALNRVLVAFIDCYKKGTWMTYSTYTTDIQPNGTQQIQTIRTANDTYAIPIYTRPSYCTTQYGPTVITTSIQKIVDIALQNDVGVCINYGQNSSITMEVPLLRGVLNMVNNNVQKFTNYGVEFRKYLEGREYKPSTVGQYISSIEKIILWESYSGWQDVVDNINVLVRNYEIGGIHSELGARGHNTVINALRRFKEYLYEKEYNY